MLLLNFLHFFGGLGVFVSFAFVFAQASQTDTVGLNSWKLVLALVILLALHTVVTCEAWLLASYDYFWILMILFLNNHILAISIQQFCLKIWDSVTNGIFLHLKNNLYLN